MELRIQAGFHIIWWSLIFILSFVLKHTETPKKSLVIEQTVSDVNYRTSGQEEEARK